MVDARLTDSRQGAPRTSGRSSQATCDALHRTDGTIAPLHRRSCWTCTGAARLRYFRPNCSKAPVVVFPSEEQRCRAIHLCGACGRCKWCGAELQLVRARRREAMIESLHATSRKLMSERASSSLTSGKSAGLSLAASASRALSVARTLGAAAGFCVTRDCHALAHPSSVSGTMT